MGSPRRIIKTAGAQSAMLDGTLVMLHADSGRFFTLDDTGLAIWQLLDEECEVGPLVDRLVKQYEIDADECRTQVDRFADQLVAAGFAEIH